MSEALKNRSGPDRFDRRKPIQGIRVLTADDRDWICEHAVDFARSKNPLLADSNHAVLCYEMTVRDLESQILAARRGEETWKTLYSELDERLQMAAGQRDAARDVHLRRHRRLAAALGLDDGYSVDATIDEAIRRAAPQEPR